MKRFALAFALTFLLGAPVAAVDLGVAFRAAIAADPGLASATANRDAAQENIAIARAKLLPQISLQTTAQQTNQSTERSGIMQQFSGASNSAQLNLRQALFRRRDTAGLDIGKLQALLGDYRMVATQTDLWGRTAAAWVDVLASQSMREIYRRTVESLIVSAAQEKRRFELGDGTRDTMAEAAAQLALARAQFAENSLDLDARLRVFNLITRMSVKDFKGWQLPSIERLGVLPEAEEALLARILDTNAEVRAAQIGEQIGERRLAQASADHLPTLDLVGGFNRGQNDSTSTLGLRYNNSQVGVQLAVPIYSGGGISSSERQATAAVTAAKADRDALIQKLQTQYLTDWSAQSALKERVNAAEQLLGAALEQRRAAELGLQAGVRTWADVGAADLLRSRRESELINLTANFIKVQARLLALLPPDDPAWDRWTKSVSVQAQR